MERIEVRYWEEQLTMSVFDLSVCITVIVTVCEMHIYSIGLIHAKSRID
jgi:hypothetical protein